MANKFVELALSDSEEEAAEDSFRIFDNMSRLQECPICFRSYAEVDPTTFLCGHTCCLEEARTLKNCPECKIDLASQGEMVVNVTLRDLVVCLTKLPQLKKNALNGKTSKTKHKSKKGKKGGPVNPLSTINRTPKTDVPACATAPVTVPQSNPAAFDSDIILETVLAEMEHEEHLNAMQVKANSFGPVSCEEASNASDPVPIIASERASITTDFNTIESDVKPKNCAVCGGRGAYCCSKCRNILYCSKQCQTKDWRTHKSVCTAKDSRATMESLMESDEFEQVFRLFNESKIAGTMNNSTSYHHKVDIQGKRFYCPFDIDSFTDHCFGKWSKIVTDSGTPVHQRPDVFVNVALKNLQAAIGNQQDFVQFPNACCTVRNCPINIMYDIVCDECLQ